jgi:hypothetical protein
MWDHGQSSTITALLRHSLLNIFVLELCSAAVKAIDFASVKFEHLLSEACLTTLSLL